MKPILTITFFLFCCTSLFAQEKLINDIDFDTINDTVYIDTEKAVLVCRLSTQNFKIAESQEVEFNEQSQILEAKNGFKFTHPAMRSGFSAQFRYHKKQKKMQLIGMEIYNFGNAANEGSGEGSVNLLTNEYVGTWNYYDYDANDDVGELVQKPTIKSKMRLGIIYFEKFGEPIVDDFVTKNAALIEKQEQQLKKNKNEHTP